MTRYIKTTHWGSTHSFDLEDSTLDEVLAQVAELKDSFPYLHTPRTGEPYVVTHCTIDLRDVSYEDYKSIYVDEWREMNQADYAAEKKDKDQRDAQAKHYRQRQFETLSKEFGESK